MNLNSGTFRMVYEETRFALGKLFYCLYNNPSTFVMVIHWIFL